MWVIIQRGQHKQVIQQNRWCKKVCRSEKKNIRTAGPKESECSYVLCVKGNLSECKCEAGAMNAQLAKLKLEELLLKVIGLMNKH